MLRTALLRVPWRICCTAAQEATSLNPAAPAEAVLTAHRLLAAAASATLQQTLWASLRAQQLHTSSCLAAVTAAAQQPQHFLRLDRLTTAPGSRKQAKRWGRGNGGDRGSYCGRGVKGQKSRKGNKPHLLFDGGQKQLKKYPKVWLTPSSPVLYKQVSLGKVLRWVHLGLLDPTEVITMKDLRDSNCVSKSIRWGVELVASGQEQIQTPLHIQVSSISPKAQAAVEAAGGSVTRVYYTKLGLRALLKPENFAKKGLQLPRPVRAWPPRENGRFDVIGQIPPLKQLPGDNVPVQQPAAA
eukprot:GHUV01006037.1.p1 GENE.GHUV01006037.1~~GHUV01006037.1.p1  ORF type:complete len:298 (+),score=59.21 GHUV01006037.1:210-1103(+)